MRPFLIPLMYLPLLGVLALTVGTLQFHTTGEFLLHQQSKTTFFASPLDRSKVHSKFAFRVVVTRVECFSKSGFTPNQMSFATFRASVLLL